MNRIVERTSDARNDLVLRLVRASLAGAFVIVGISCQLGHTISSAEPANAGDPSSRVDPVAERLYASAFSALDRPARDVVTDSASWADYWRRIVGPRYAAQSIAPAVDFAEARVVVVAGGRQAQASPSVAIERVELSDSMAVVRIVRRVVGGACGTATAETSPIDVYRLPQPGPPVRFVERADTLTCAAR